MALLIVPKESWSTPQQANQSNEFGVLAELVDPALRRKIAKDVNEAILQSQGEEREAKIRFLVRTRAWAEQLAREKRIDLPEKLSLGLDGDDHDQEQAGNGHSHDTEMAEGVEAQATRTE